MLLSGDHARIELWRRQQSLLRTWQRRPDLLAAASLTPQDLEFLSRLESEQDEGQTRNEHGGPR
jgi:tRNA (guanine37-N1)-methyltransferase